MFTTPVVILGLADYYDRIEETRRRLLPYYTTIDHHLGINGHRYPDLLDERLTYWGANSNRGDFRPTQQGCTFNHLDTWMTLRSSTDEWVLIVEDDLTLPDNWATLYQQILAEPPRTADLVFLGWELPAGSSVNLTDQAFIFLAPMCMHCYLVRVASIPKLLSAVRADKLDIILDVWIATRAEHYGIVCACANPRYFIATPCTDIRINRADGIAYQDARLPSTIDIKPSCH